MLENNRLRGTWTYTREEYDEQQEEALYVLREMWLNHLRRNRGGNARKGEEGVLDKVKKISIFVGNN